MKVKIIDSKPINGASDIEQHIGKIFDTYKDEDDNLMAYSAEKSFPSIDDFIIFEGEYEIVEDC